MQPQQHEKSAALPSGWRAWLLQAANIVSALMFAAVFLIFNYKIITRYLEHDEAVWTDEVSVILFIWIIFWANAFLIRDREQITFDLCYRPMPDTTKRWMALARLVLVGGIFLWALPGTLDYLMFLWRERTPVLSLRLDLVYSCFGIFMIAVVIREAASIVKLLGPNWRRHI